MATGRGSKQILRMIKEATYGTTPSMPTMLEIPFNTLTPDWDINVAKSGQTRSHPFTDRLLQGPQVSNLGINTELQDANHDILLELMCGASFGSGSVKMTDALLGATVENEHTDLVLFDRWTGFCITKGDFTFPAQVGGIVTANYTGMAKTGVPDGATPTIATVTTAAAANDPYMFHQAALTVGGVATPATSVTFSINRTIDPLYLLGAIQPNEYIPSEVGITGQIVVPYRDALQSTRLLAFTEAALVVTGTDTGHSITFTFPKINFTKLGKPIQGRGAILQTIDWEAKYDTSTSTVLTIAKT